MIKYKLKENVLSWKYCFSNLYTGKIGKLGEISVIEIYYDHLVKDHFLICFLPGVNNDPVSRFLTIGEGLQLADKIVLEWIKRAGLERKN